MAKPSSTNYPNAFRITLKCPHELVGLQGRKDLLCACSILLFLQECQRYWTMINVIYRITMIEYINHENLYDHLDIDQEKSQEV